MNSYPQIASLPRRELKRRYSTDDMCKHKLLATMLICKNEPVKNNNIDQEVKLDEINRKITRRHTTYDFSVLNKLK